MSFKKVFSFLMVLLLALSLVSCKKPDSGNEGGGETPQVEVDKALAEEFKGLGAGVPTYITTVGQADLALALGVLKRVPAASEVQSSSDLEAADVVADGVKPLVLLVVGGSGKGLGGAGVSVASESQRAADFVTAADEGKISLVVLHIGGNDRRGDNTDPILDVACPGADLLIVIEGGNADSYFTNSAKTNNVPLYLYSGLAKLVEPFTVLYTAK